MTSLLIDVGGTYLKTCVVDSYSNQLIDFKRYNMPKLILNSPKRVEISKRELSLTINCAVNKALTCHEDIQSVYLSGQMGCWSLESEIDGLSNFSSWQDRRVLEKYSSLSEFISELKLQNLHALNGNEIEIGTPVIGILADLHQKEMEHKLLYFSSLIHWSGSHLTKNSKAAIQLTDAASSGIVSFPSEMWNQNLFNFTKTKILFPTITSRIEPIGNLFNSNIQVYCGVGDQQASLLGVGLSSNTIILNIGTGGQVAVANSSKETKRAKIRPYFFGERFKTITHLPSGRFLQKIIKVVNAQHNASITFEHLNCVDVGIQHKSLSKIFSSDLETLDAINITQIRVEDFLGSAIFFMATQYIEAIEELAVSDNFKIVFAGGVGQKCTSLITNIISRLGKPNYVVSEEQETTLAGLREISFLQN